jgi:hypothetical protein
MVRTHCAAYEHATPHMCGGLSDITNIVHTSVQLNESKGAKILLQIDIPDDTWQGLTQYVSRLRQQRSASNKRLLDASTWAKDNLDLPSCGSRRRSPKMSGIYEAASGLPVRIFDLAKDEAAEEAFSRYRKANENSYFATPRRDGTWMLHRLRCSSLAFNGPQKLTMKAKICAVRSDQIVTWAARLGVELRACRRCPSRE